MSPREQAHDRRRTDPKNPALAAEADQPVERTYKVVGPRNVLGNAPGAQFKATLPLEQEKHLIEAGHIKREKEKGA